MEGSTQILGLGKQRASSKKSFIKCWLNSCLIFEGKDVWIVEVKTTRLNWEAVGQILGYKALFEDDWSNVNVIGLGIVCEEENSDEFIEHACQKLGIHVWKMKV